MIEIPKGKGAEPNEQSKDPNQSTGSDRGKPKQEEKQTPAKGKPPGPSKPKSGGPGPEAPPEELPVGNPPQLTDAYDFLQSYLANEMQGLPPGLPDEIDQPFQGIENVIPQTSTNVLKSPSKFGPGAGALPSPGTATGQYPKTLVPNSQQLVGGLPANQVKIQQMKLPNKKDKNTKQRG